MIEDSRRRRELQIEGKEIKITCNQCYWTTKSNALFKIHMRKEHNIMSILNPTEQNRNSTEYSIEKIQKKTYVHKRIKCDKCDKKFNKKETFTKHMESVHKEKVQITE